MNPAAFAPQNKTPAIIPLPALQDNYVWLVRCGDECVVIDPGEAAPVRDYLARHAVRLAAILVTHHHHDHTGGVEALRAHHDAPVYAPAPQQAGWQCVREGAQFALCGGALHLTVWEIPGHTATHIGWLARLRGLDAAHFFCGDTLFCAGCGRLLGGTAAQLHQSLSRIMALPADTVLCPAHEYTLGNLAFAQHVEPDNPARDAFLQEARALREANRPTLPTTVAREAAINPFVRAASLAQFAELRAQKDKF